MSSLTTFSDSHPLVNYLEHALEQARAALVYSGQARPARVTQTRFLGHRMRVVMWKGEPWFDVDDLCALLDISRLQLFRLARTGENDPVDWLTIRMIDFGREQMEVITVSGIYTVASSYPPGSDMHTFRDWVRTEFVDMEGK